MAWFRRKTAGIHTKISQQINVPEGHWVKCPGCSTTINQREIGKNLKVCPNCSHHFKLSSNEYFELLFDNGQFQVYDDTLISVDPLKFVDKKSYSSRLETSREKTQLSDAARTAMGMIGGHRISVASMDFSFIGGSMGSVVGEVVTRAIRRACSEKTALLVIAQSGGARMMEGALSLMQMAKTSANLGKLEELGLPFMVLLTNPTTGGVTASFAMLGDIHFAEPGALIGFAGPRIIRETMGQDLPDGFQRSEFLLERGFVDRIVDRRELRQELVQYLDLILEDDPDTRK
ncbi:MAG: acetyl-CoA carboxylase carboxyltransferase subunit beta [Bacteroidetes bacterium]|nr:acetyl-CoA carboxylase carboxyltransferase subunit beta [Bacteroidota bacterium]